MLCFMLYCTVLHYTNLIHTYFRSSLLALCVRTLLGVPQKCFKYKSVPWPN
jgi:hypothetical protein